eukprot:scaffold84178_cov30-Tisochrysis_lutea.AAC.5
MLPEGPTIKSCIPSAALCSSATSLRIRLVSAFGSKPPKGWASSKGPAEPRGRIHAMARVAAGRHRDTPSAPCAHANPHAQHEGRAPKRRNWPFPPLLHSSSR